MINTTESTLNQRFSELPIKSPAIYGPQNLSNQHVSYETHEQPPSSQIERPT